MANTVLSSHTTTSSIWFGRLKKADQLLIYKYSQEDKPLLWNSFQFVEMARTPDP